MDEEKLAEGEPEPRLEIYDHAGPKGLGLAAVASLFFFAGGQLVKGKFRRALALWACLAGVAVIMGVGASLTEPGSTARDVVLFPAIGAVGLLWIYQWWDAVSNP